ncbi:unnamed protein product [Prorocentrum cordatum]|uniref:Potassium channel domain-containing protein n=1 Tax=Prorocentrum cordatum TaxID=2364126 RepID=A0ABN9UKF3_9DINO|nr:unnamed protein product [Polarella glacialis]
MLTAALWLAVGWLVLVGKKKLAHMSGVEGIAAVLYWQVQIITTVGYGDMCPDSDDTRLFVAVYVVVGNVVAGVGVMDYLKCARAGGGRDQEGLAVEVRSTLEAAAAASGGRLVRVNLEDSEPPPALEAAGRAVGIPLGALEALRRIDALVAG